MKLDKIKFAKLVSHIQSLMHRRDTLNEDDIRDLDYIIDIDIPEPDVIHPASSDISQLMFLMQQGTYKIEAIKLHRKLTGWGLKESKEEVEKYWRAKLPADHTLGDKLGIS